MEDLPFTVPFRSVGCSVQFRAVPFSSVHVAEHPTQQRVLLC